MSSEAGRPARTRALRDDAGAGDGLDPPSLGRVDGPWRLENVRRAATWLFAAVAVASCFGAFVGLSASSWWTDELFTLFLIDHRGGAPEVLRRALTDTQPPAYYLLLYGWSQLAGRSETALRSLSAILAVASVATVWGVTRGVFSRGARAWAAAAAVTSPLWFVQSQNIRNYSLCLLLAAVMLGLALRLRREVRAGRAWPWASWAALTAVGALDAATHFYGLLGVGALWFALIVSLPSWRLRAALAASGVAIAAGELAYIHLLVAHTHENLQHLWFRKDPAHLLSILYDVWKLATGGAVRFAVLLFAAAWTLSTALDRARLPLPSRSGPGEDAAWLSAVCAFVLVALYLGGVGVSLLFAPSLSDRNVLTWAPAAWIVLAALYDAAMRRAAPQVGGALALVVGVLLVFHAVTIGRGRWMERNEPWRETAQYVASLPSCRNAVLDVVQPDRFGPDTPFYRMIAQRYLFGAYLGGRWPQVQPHLRADFTDPVRSPDLARRLAIRAKDPASCPVLAWAVHDVDTDQAAALRRRLADLPGVSPAAVRLREFSDEHLTGDRWIARPAGYVIERARP